VTTGDSGGARHRECFRSSPRGRHRRLPGGHGLAALPPRPPPVARCAQDGRHTVLVGGRLQRSVPAPASLPSCRPDRARSTHTRRTALLANQPLGSAEVTHPFHPRRGQRFVVLKVRQVSGVETLSLRHVELGSFAVPREWTDWAPLDARAAPTGGQPLLIDAFGLLALTEFVTLLTRNGGLDR
jgi:hypothetical protein